MARVKSVLRLLTHKLTHHKMQLQGQAVQVDLMSTDQRAWCSIRL